MEYIPRFSINKHALNKICQFVSKVKLEQLHICDSAVYTELKPNKIHPAPVIIMIAANEMLGPAFNFHADVRELKKLNSILKRTRQKEIQIFFGDKYSIPLENYSYLLKRLSDNKPEEIPKRLIFHDKRELCADCLLDTSVIESIGAMKNALEIRMADIFIQRNRILGVAIPDKDMAKHGGYGAYCAIRPGEFCDASDADIVLRSGCFAPTFFNAQLEIKVLYLPRENRGRYWLATRIPIDGINGWMLEPLLKVAENIRQRTEQEIDSELSALAGRFKLSS